TALPFVELRALGGQLALQGLQACFELAALGGQLLAIPLRGTESSLQLGLLPGGIAHLALELAFAGLKLAGGGSQRCPVAGEAVAALLKVGEELPAQLRQLSLHGGQFFLMP